MAVPTPQAWSAAQAALYAPGYQWRHFGVAGSSVLSALAVPPTAMVEAAGNPSVGPAGPDEPEPVPY